MKDLFIKCSISLLIILWVYTAGSKLLDLADFRNQLHLQHFSPSTIAVLIFLLPTLELLTAILLMLNTSPKVGLYSSAILLTIFTLYIILILSGYYIQTPCSCGGVLKLMSWKTHLLFNSFFLIINATTIHLYYLKGKEAEKKEQK